MRLNSKRIAAMMKPARAYHTAERADVTHIYLYDEIGFWGVQAEDVVRDILAVKTPVIHLHLNSPGGDVFEGLAIYNALKKSPAEVEVIVDGIAASIASIIALGGKKVTMGEGSFIMIHNPWTIAMGDATQMKKTADILDKIGAELASIYARAMGKTVEECLKIMADETYWNADEALENAFAHTIEKKADTEDQTDPTPSSSLKDTQLLAMDANQLRARLAVRFAE